MSKKEDNSKYREATGGITGINTNATAMIHDIIDSYPQDHVFTVYTVADDLERNHGLVTNISIIQRACKNLLKESALFFAEEPSHNLAYKYTKKRPPDYNYRHNILVEIPISRQSDLWNVMSHICGPKEPEQKHHLTLADVYRWNDICVSIWNARQSAPNNARVTSSLDASAVVVFPSRKAL
jgi:hypothetical protein